MALDLAFLLKLYFHHSHKATLSSFDALKEYCRQQDPFIYLDVQINQK